jgi:hypothetical protein
MELTMSDNEVSVPTLPQAYWLYGVVGNIAISIVAVTIWGKQLPPVALLGWTGYNVYVVVLIWAAAEQYTGFKLWKGLAQAAAILSLALIIATLVLVGRDVLSRLDNLQPGRGIIEQLLW